MMNDHDRDLIAALAEGSLSPEEAAAVQARVDADPAAAAELAAQHAALQALRAAPRPQLDDLERARLRRSVADELGVVMPTPSARHRERRSWRINWAGVAVAAAVLLVVALIAPLASLLSTSDDADTAAFDITAATEAPAETALDDAARSLAPAEESLTESAAAATTAAPAATDAAAAEAATPPVAADAEEPAAALAAPPDFGPLDQVGLDELRTELLTLATDRVGDLESAAGTEAAPCAAEAGVEGETTLPATLVGTAEFDGIAVLLYVRSPADTEEPVVVVLDAITCEVVTTAPAG